MADGEDEQAGFQPMKPKACVTSHHVSNSLPTEFLLLFVFPKLIIISLCFVLVISHSPVGVVSMSTVRHSVGASKATIDFVDFSCFFS